MACTADTSIWGKDFRNKWNGPYRDPWGKAVPKRGVLRPNVPIRHYIMIRGQLPKVEYYPLEFFQQFKPYCRTFWETIEQ